jgi:hypothetical protein
MGEGEGEGGGAGVGVGGLDAKVWGVAGSGVSQFCSEVTTKPVSIAKTVMTAMTMRMTVRRCPGVNSGAFTSEPHVLPMSV